MTQSSQIDFKKGSRKELISKNEVSEKPKNRIGNSSSGVIILQLKILILVLFLDETPFFQDLKDLIREASFADAHKKREGTG